MADANLYWTKPNEGYIKCNIDCANFINEHKMAFGICFRGFHGEFIIVNSSWTNAQYSVVEDEAFAILLSLQIAEILGFTHVCFE
jgi:hypothetical protein